MQNYCGSASKIHNPNRGTQVNAEALATNTSVLLWEVTAGKTLYITAASLWIEFNNGASSAGVEVRNAAGVTQYYLLRGGTRATSFGGIAQSYPDAVKVPAGYKIYICHGAVDGAGYGAIHGWEENNL